MDESGEFVHRLICGLVCALLWCEAAAGGSSLRPAELLPEGSDNDPARTALVEWRHSGGGDVTSVVGCGEHFGSADAAALAGLGPTFAELPSQSALVAALLQARPHPRHFLDTS